MTVKMWLSFRTMIRNVYILWNKLNIYILESNDEKTDIHECVCDVVQFDWMEVDCWALMVVNTPLFFFSWFMKRCLHICEA